MGPPTKKERVPSKWPWGAALVITVFLVYSPVWWAGFVWDDVSVVTGNPVVVGPLGLKEIWTTKAADICPLTLTAFWFEYKMWGSNPLPYHLVNVLMHAASAVLLWQVLRRLKIPGAWLGAALWALHPVQVESVAWISEMKNTQSGLFYLLTILFFVKGLPSDGREKRNYGLMWLFAAMAMASKSSTVVLPLVLCLCAWWMEKRWHWRNLVKMLPVFLMSAAASALSIWTQAQKIETPGENYVVRDWQERLMTAGCDAWFYLDKLAWPHPLLTVYPRWHTESMGALFYSMPLLAVVVVLIVLWFYRNSWGRPWFFTFVYFLVALLPVLGLLDNTIFSYSPVFDHLQYLASMGPLALAGAGIARLSGFLPAATQQLCPVFAAGILTLLAITTWRQACIYKNEYTLWNYTLAWDPKSWPAHHSLGVILDQDGRHDEAIAEFARALEIDPHDAAIHNNLGHALAAVGKLDEAIDHLNVAIKLNPRNAMFHDNLGNVLFQKGKIDEAMAEYHESLKLDSIHADAHYGLGVVLAQKGDIDEAITEFQSVIQINPNDAEAHNNLGVEFMQKGRADEAAVQFQQALKLKPDDASAHDNLAKAEAMTLQDRKK